MTRRWREMDSNFQYASTVRWHRATDLPLPPTVKRRKTRDVTFRNRKFVDLYGSFSVKWFFGLLPVPCWSGEAVPRHVAAIRFAKRAERCQGTEMLAQLSGLPLSVACVFAAP